MTQSPLPHAETVRVAPTGAPHDSEPGPDRSPAPDHDSPARAASCAQALRRQRRRIGTELDLLRSLRLEARDRDWGSLPATLTEAIALIEAGHAKLRAAAAWLDQRGAGSDAPLVREGGRDGN